MKACPHECTMERTHSHPEYFQVLQPLLDLAAQGSLWLQQPHEGIAIIIDAGTRAYDVTNNDRFQVQALEVKQGVAVIAARVEAG